MNPNDIKNIVQDGFKSLKGNPRAVAIGGTAALVAPFFVRNDQRGYLESALITTPLVAAGTMVGPHIFRTAKDTYGKVAGFAERGFGHQASADFKFFRTEYEAGRLSRTEFNRRAKSFYTNLTATSRDLDTEIGHVVSQLDEVLGDPSKHFMLANVIYSSEYRNASALELAAGLEQMQVNPNAMRDRVMAKLNSSNPQYIREMNFRLQKIKGLQDRGVWSFTKGKGLKNLKGVDEFGDPIVDHVLGRRRWSSRYVRKALMKQDREAFREIHKAIAQGKISAGEIELLSFDQPTNKAINKIVGLQINRQGEKPFRIGLLQEDGMIHTGEFFERRGYMRDVGDLHWAGRGDIWGIRMSGDLGHLREHFGSIQFGSFPEGDDTFNTLKETEFLKFRQSKNVAFLRRNEMVMNPISGFGEAGDLGWDTLAKDPDALEKARLAMMRRHDLVAMGPTGSFKRVLQRGELAKAVSSGNWNAADQSWELRWLKPIHIDTSQTIPGFHAPHSRTSFFQNVGVTEYVLGTNVHSVSPHIKNLVEALAAIKANELSGTDSKAIRERAIGIIRQELSERGMNVTSGEVKRQWAQLRGWLEQGTNLEDIRKLGYLGEGTTLALGNAPNTIIERRAYVDPDSLRVDLDAMIASGEEFGDDLLLGTFNKNLITAQQKKNIVRGYEKTLDGRLAIFYDEIVGIEHAKTDHMTKGHMMAANPAEAGAIREFTNLYHQTLKTGDVVTQETPLMALRNYNADKARALRSYNDLAGDLLKRLELGGNLDIVDDSLARLEQSGYKYNRLSAGGGGDFVWDANRTIPGGLEVLDARRAQNAANNALIEQMFMEVGSRLNEVKDRGIRHFSQVKTGEDLLDWYFRNIGPTNITAWNTTSNTIPDRASLTYDMAEAMSLRGQDEMLKELWGRSRTDGDIFMTQELMGRMNDGNYTGLPEKTVAEAFPQLDAGYHLSDAEFRASSVFDPKDPFAAKNWGLRLGEGEVLPVLGHEAFGGKINMYGEGLFAVSKRESALYAAMKAYGTSDFAEKKEAYLNEVRRFGWGKQNFLRAPRIDPLGISGRIQNAPSPFGEDYEMALGISPQDVDKIRDKAIRDAVRKGEAYGVGFRHPVSSAPSFRVYVDERLDEGVFGLNEKSRGLLMADNDGDSLNLSMFKPDSPAAVEAKNAAERTSSLLAHELKIHRAIEGVGDYTQLAGGGGYTPLSNRARAELSQDIAKSIKARGAGASVGRLSNVLTYASMGLETNSVLLDPAKKIEAQWVLWEALRQAPIRMQKKSELNYGLSNAMELADEIEAGLMDKSEAGFNRFYRALEGAGASFGKEVEGPYLQEVGLDLSRATQTKSGKYNGLLEMIRQREEMWRDYHQGVNPDVAAMSRGMTATEDALKSHFRYGGKALDESFDLLPYLSISRGGARPAESTGANMATDMIRAINEAAREVGGAARKAFGGKTATLLGLGLAAGAVAGVVSTDLGSRPIAFTPESGNRFRPEEKLGVTDRIPGEPEEGAMAPTSPPRRIIPAPSTVKNTYVAPIHNAVDLEVRTRVEDRSRAIEQAKMMSRLSTDGDSVVTVNYRSNPKKRSLRMQERMRDNQERFLR